MDRRTDKAAYRVLCTQLTKKPRKRNRKPLHDSLASLNQKVQTESLPKPTCIVICARVRNYTHFGFGNDSNLSTYSIATDME